MYARKVKKMCAVCCILCVCVCVCVCVCERERVLKYMMVRVWCMCVKERKVPWNIRWSVCVVCVCERERERERGFLEYERVSVWHTDPTFGKERTNIQFQHPRG